MKKSILSALFAFFACSIVSSAADYTITGVNTSSGDADKFYGIQKAIEQNKVSPRPPVSGITAADNVKVLNYYDIENASLNVKSFDYTSNGKYGNGLSMYGTNTFTVEKLYFRVEYPFGSGTIHDCEFVNLNSGAKFTLNGAIQTSSNIRFGQSTTMTGATVMTFNPYKAGVTSVSNVNKFVIFYATNGNSSATLNINTGASVYANGIEGIGRQSGHTYSYFTNVNINGGSLYLGSFTYSFSNDNYTINHLSGTLGAQNSSLAISTNGLAGTIKYVIGENSIFDTNNRKITLDSSVVMSSAAGVKGGFTIQGGGDFIIKCKLDAVSGNVTITDGSIVSSESGWFNKASSVKIDSTVSFSMDGDSEATPDINNLVLNANSNIIIGVSDEYTHGTIMAMGGMEDAKITTSDGSYGALQFVLDEGAFATSDSITIALKEVIADSQFVDWDAFKIKSNYKHVLNSDGSITFVNVPEPATVAAILGALALALAAYRRRKNF